MKKIDNRKILPYIINYISLVLMACSGLVINLIISKMYGAAVFGVYNKTYAWYMILSQIAVVGIHSSVLQKVSENRDNTELGKSLLSSALVDILISSTTITIFAEIVVNIFVKETDFASSLRIAIAGLLLFSFNKVVLNYFNSLLKMTLYGVLQSLRFMLMMIIAIIMSLMNVKSTMLPLVFVFSELITSVLCVSILIFRGYLSKEPKIKLMMEHVRFGIKILPANLGDENQTKVDVICLGLLNVDNSLIGIYSFATMFVEGFFQLYVILRRFINPKIAEATHNKKVDEYIVRTNRMFGVKVYGLAFIALIAIELVFAFFVYILQDAQYASGVFVIAIISVSMIIVSLPIIYGNLLAQIDRPVQQTFVDIGSLVFNYILNLCLIYILGIYGAAVATAFSYIMFGIMLNYFCRKNLGLSIWKT